MAKHKMPPVKEDISPNLVPMIDVMFLLLLFFMLGADMAVREAANLMLPQASKVKADDTYDKDPTTTVNVHRDDEAEMPFLPSAGPGREGEKWLVSVAGQDYTPETLKTLLQVHAESDLEDDIDPDAKKRLSRRKLLVRADRGAPYGFVQRVIEAAGLAGLYKVEVAAAEPSGI